MSSNLRHSRAQKAQETLDIIGRGYYQLNDKKILLAEKVNYSVENTSLYAPTDYVVDQAKPLVQERHFETTITVKNCTTMEAAVSLLAENEKLACLNFASAKNPGGGFLGGAQAQEESLARASSLYPSLIKYNEQMYEYNRKQKTYLYSDYMIYSPDIVFFKDDNDILLETPYQMDILTSPAVNVGAMGNNKPQELAYVDEVMMIRLDKILSIFVSNGAENLVLGAWGCGVFQNDPVKVAEYFAHYLKNNGKYTRCFRKIVFAVYARGKNQENIVAFENIFNL